MKLFAVVCYDESDAGIVLDSLWKKEKDAKSRASKLQDLIENGDEENEEPPEVEGLHAADYLTIDASEAK